MTTRRPLVIVSGVMQEISSGDTLPTDIVPVTESALVDGGTPSTSPTGVFKIDFGAVT